MEKHHEFTMEKIYHFVCGECKNWWSHATDMIYRRGQNMSCPHCGEIRTSLFKYRKETVAKRTSIGKSKNSKPKGKHKNRRHGWKKYRGQG
jgi:uncharacterized Zn ribbon protein